MRTTGLRCYAHTPFGGRTILTSIPEVRTFVRTILHLGMSVMAEPLLYNGRRTTAGNSDALRFDKQLFRRHPEFRGAVKARILSKGVLLVVAEEEVSTEAATEEHEDPLLAAWLGFIAQDHAACRDMSEERA